MAPPLAARSEPGEIRPPILAETAQIRVSARVRALEKVEKIDFFDENFFSPAPARRTPAERPGGCPIFRSRFLGPEPPFWQILLPTTSLIFDLKSYLHVGVGTQTRPNDPPGPLSPPQIHPGPTWAPRSAPGGSGVKLRFFDIWSHHTTPTWPIGCTPEAGWRGGFNYGIFLLTYVVPDTLVGT